MATKCLSMKLLVDNKTKKVLFAEAGKDVIDFLFSLLAMPVGTIVKLLTKESMVGCIANLYRSAETIDETYIISKQTIKSLLLDPTAPAKNTLFLTGRSSARTDTKKYYRCSYTGNNECRSYYTEVCNTQCPTCNNYMKTEMRHVVCNTQCPTCNNYMKTEMRHVANPGGSNIMDSGVDGANGGFVKGVVTYSVMDDLTVTPMSTISSITMLNRFHVKDVGLLEERNVKLGLKEGVELLKASLQSKTVLTDVFISTKA